ncbi:major intrinsic protein [Streptomyces sp. SLBN-115]|nr:major intrinsic protein [Streptomyces sp. SLBN-115]
MSADIAVHSRLVQARATRAPDARPTPPGAIRLRRHARHGRRAGRGFSLPRLRQPREPHPVRSTGVDPPRAGPRSRHEQRRHIRRGEVIGTATPGIFSTIPEIRNPVANLITEIIATIALVLPVLAFGLTEGLGESGITVLIVSLLVVGIGLSLGGPTGCAINPARDLGPRVVHTFLPIPNKGTSDWGYAWIPVVGPLVGGALAGLLYDAAEAPSDRRRSHPRSLPNQLKG